jgi:hypothetical protein
VEVHAGETRHELSPRQGKHGGGRWIIRVRLFFRIVLRTLCVVVHVVVAPVPLPAGGGVGIAVAVMAAAAAVVQAGLLLQPPPDARPPKGTEIFSF